VVAPLLTVAIASTFLFRPDGRVLEFEMKATGASVAQLFWSDSYAFNGNDSGTALLHQHPGDFERVRFQLPAKRLELLRFDPLNGPGEVIVRAIRVLDFQGRTLRTIDPMAMMPLYQIALMTPDGAGARILTTPAADDPMLVMRASWLVQPHEGFSAQFVTPVSLAWIALAVFGVVATGAGLVAGDLLAGPFRARNWLWFAALFVAVLWAKVTLLQHYPVPVPFWDQWDGEAATLYIPYPLGGVSWRQMFTLHNEHRIFFSRLLALSLLAVNGQWDPHLQIVVNAALHALAAVICAAVLWLGWQRRHLPLVTLLVAMAFAPPFGLENTLAGFQSAFYFLVLFSILALWLMGTRRPGTAAWWLGFLCALCCPFTVAGGVFVVVAIGTIAILRAIGHRDGWRQTAGNIAAMASVGALGYGGLPPPIPYHVALKASTIPAFLRALGHNLAFPWTDIAWAGPVLWLPVIVLVVTVLRHRLRTTTFEQVCLSIAAWVGMQAVAVAYSRGVNGAVPASRYLDMLCFGFVVNGMALTALLERRKAGKWTPIAIGILALWFVVGAVGIARLSHEMVVTSARVRREWSREHLRNVRQFVLSGDLDTFMEGRGPRNLPYHSPALLAGWLQHPYIRRILPARVREPIQVRPAPDVTQHGFSRGLSAGSADAQPMFDSYAPEGRRGEGRFESQPMSCKDFSHLRVEVAGSASWSGLRLALRELQSGRETIVQPSFRQPGWTGVSVRCPNGPFVLVAADASPTNWLAFREPAEIGWASAVADSTIQDSPVLGVAVVALAVLALVYARSDGSIAGEPSSNTPSVDGGTYAPAR
jgi:hypothetical protein